MTSTASAKKLTRRVREAARTSTAQAILDAAEAAFAADGLASTAMQTIAARAGTSVGTLYNYFADKDALVLALFEDRRRRLSESIDSALAADVAGFEPRLRALVRAVLVHFDTHRAFLRVALEADQTSTAKKRSAMLLLRERVRTLIDTGVREKKLEARLAALSSAALFGTLRAVLLAGIDGDEPFEPLTDDVVALYLHGAGARR